MAKRKAPPFRFVKKAQAFSDGKLKPACRQVRTPSGLRYLCKKAR